MVNQKKISNLVTGGAGFLGSHLIDRLMFNNESVICIDNFFTGRKSNIYKWINNPNFQLIEHDVIEPIDLPNIDRIWHLACPASPIHYQINPIKTCRTSFLGTYNMLELSKKTKAKILLASTSEIYGDPEINPQPETYNGSVNTTGLRSCYDEGKRIAETLFSDYKRIHNLDIRIIRIFNTYGPRMRPDDGRVISNFIVKALNNKPLSINGDGSQTRSFCYVDDLVNGMIKLMENNFSKPINIGNPNELTIIDLAQNIKNMINPNLKFIFKSLPQDDPTQRRPDIKLAYEKLNWEPKISLDEGLKLTIKWFKESLNN